MTLLPNTPTPRDFENFAFSYWRYSVQRRRCDGHLQTVRLFERRMRNKPEIREIQNRREGWANTTWDGKHRKYKNTRRVHMVKQCPFLACCHQWTWENHGMERHIVFAHKLIQLHIFGVLPPFLPILSVVCGNGQITKRRKWERNGSGIRGIDKRENIKQITRKNLENTAKIKDSPDRRIKPNIKNFVFVSRFRHFRSPLQVSGDAARLQSFFQPRMRDLDSVLSPFSCQ